MAADGPAVKAGYTWAALDPLGLTALAATPGVPCMEPVRIWGLPRLHRFSSMAKRDLCCDV